MRVVCEVTTCNMTGRMKINTTSKGQSECVCVTADAVFQIRFDTVFASCFPLCCVSMNERLHLQILPHRIFDLKVTLHHFLSSGEDPMWSLLSLIDLITPIYIGFMDESKTRIIHHHSAVKSEGGERGGMCGGQQNMCAGSDRTGVITLVLCT